MDKFINSTVSANSNEDFIILYRLWRKYNETRMDPQTRQGEIKEIMNVKIDNLRRIDNNKNHDT